MLCRCQLGSYILRAGFCRSQTALWRGRWVKIDKQSIPSVHVGRGPSSLHGMISPIRTRRPRRLPTSSTGLVASVGLSVTAATFCENFGVTQKLSQTWACFTRCLGKSGKAAKANSCASDTRHALPYAPRHACVRMYHANWMCQRVLRHFARRRLEITLPRWSCKCQVIRISRKPFSLTDNTLTCDIHLAKYMQKIYSLNILICWIS